MLSSAHTDVLEHPMRSLFILLVLMGTTAHAAEPAPAADGVASEVRAAFRRFEANLNEGNYAAALAFYADDPRFVAYEDGQTRYSSHADLAAAFEQLPAFGKGVFRYGELEVLVLGEDHAQVAAPFSTAFGEVGDPRYFYFEGLLTTVLERFDSGWKMLSIHSSTLQARE